MQKDYTNNWNVRHFLQKYPLIGSTKSDSDKGNGWHDRIAPDIEYHLWRHERNDSDLYLIYLRNLSDGINPLYSKLKEKFENSFRFKDCDANYLNTIKRYLNPSDYSRYNSIENVLTKEIGYLLNKLFFKGRIIIEVEGWYDFKSDLFYGFKLHELREEFCTITKESIIYNCPVTAEETAQTKKFIIPKSKCIIIQWPQSLGGYDAYKETVSKVLSLQNPLLNFQVSDPQGSINRLSGYQKEFNQLVCHWGLLDNFADTTEYFKQYNNFVLKSTRILCLHEVLNGIKQLFFILNKKLDQEATFSFYMFEYDLTVLELTKKMWLNNQLNFYNSSYFLK